MEQNIKPHALGKKELTRIIERLQEARRASTMERMSVSNILVPGNRLAYFEDGRSVLENNVNDFIRERLRLYNHSWITDPLEEIIEQLVASIYGSGTGRI
jgi:hypothetical protein